jgi:cullin-associated NEDD8-dissociated protein 1
MQSPDQDFRYFLPYLSTFIALTLHLSFMGLNDLMNEIKQDPNNFLGDEATENKVLRQVMALVEDKISEVKNQAVKW